MVGLLRKMMLVRTMVCEGGGLVWSVGGTSGERVVMAVLMAVELARGNSQ